MGKKNKVVEINARAEKVSDEHLAQLQKTVNTVNSIQFGIGRLEAQKHTALHDLATANDNIIVLQETLIKEYGSYNVNLETGEINWDKEDKKDGDKK